MALHRGIEGPDRFGVDRVGRNGAEVERRVVRSTQLGEGTLACPQCDAPVALPDGRPVTPMHAVACPYCGHDAAIRDFLSLAAPTRPNRVVVRVVMR